MKLTFTILFTLFSISINAQDLLVFFDKASDELTAKATQTLDNIANELIETSNLNDIAIIGHTDTDASVEYNYRLALNRTRSVKDYLKTKGLNNRFHLISKGEKENLTEEKTEEDKQLNRRVSIDLNYQYGSPIAPYFPKSAQVFKLTPNDSHVIKTEGGIQINIDKDIFKDIAWHKMIEIHVTEYFNKGDFVLGDLKTVTTNNIPLESKGMINIQAIQKEDTLELKDGKSIDLIFPNRYVEDGAELFSGIQPNNDIIWNQTTFNSGRLFTSSGWSTSWHGTADYVEDTISTSRWWYETIGDETLKITETINYEDNKKIIYDSIVAENEILMQAFTQSTSSLGWINCDRFWNDPGPKTDLIVEYDGQDEPLISVVFEDINSILPYSYREDNKFYFKNVPVGMNIKIVGLAAKNEQDDIMFGLIDYKITNKSAANINLNSKTKAEVSEIMAQL